MYKNRLEYLDVAKGIGIMFVVWAHARGPFLYQIYQFHMPLFFLISGLLYSATSSFQEFTMRRIKRLYLPFVIWNVTAIWAECFLLGGGYIAHIGSTLKVFLTLSRAGWYFGATWFLAALFHITIVYKFIDIALMPWKHRDIGILLLFVVLAVYGFIITFPYTLSRTLILGMFYAIGVSTKTHKAFLRKYDNMYTAIVCVIIFFIISPMSTSHMDVNTYNHPFLFVIGAISASYAIIYLCKQLVVVTPRLLKTAKTSLVFLGRRSIDIVIWHFVFFRIGIIMQMHLNKEPITVNNILQYYPVYDAKHGWFFVYFVIGTILPLLWCDFLRISPFGKILKKIHAV